MWRARGSKGGGNKAVNATGSQTRPLPRSSRSNLSLRGHLEADTVNDTGSQSKPCVHHSTPGFKPRTRLHRPGPGNRKRARPKARGGRGGVIRWSMQARPQAHLLHSRTLHSNFQQRFGLLSNLL